MSQQQMHIAVKADLPVTVANLESLIECLRRGSLYLRHGREAIRLNPAGYAGLELKAEIRKSRSETEERLRLVLRWESGAFWRIEAAPPDFDEKPSPTGNDESSHAVSGVLPECRPARKNLKHRRNEITAG